MDQAPLIPYHQNSTSCPFQSKAKEAYKEQKNLILAYLSYSVALLGICALAIPLQMIMGCKIWLLGLAVPLPCVLGIVSSSLYLDAHESDRIMRQQTLAVGVLSLMSGILLILAAFFYVFAMGLALVSLSHLYDDNVSYRVGRLLYGVGLPSALSLSVIVPHAVLSGMVAKRSFDYEHRILPN